MFPCEFIAAATILFVYVVEAGIGPFDLSQGKSQTYKFPIHFTLAIPAHFLSKVARIL